MTQKITDQTNTPKKNIKPLTAYVPHIVMIVSILAIMFPLWIMFVASTHDMSRMTQAPLPLLPGTHFFENLTYVFSHDVNNVPIITALKNSLIMALVITIGKIVISLLSAYAIVFFRFPLRMLFFWLIFITLMLPVEVRILPTYSVVADMQLLDTYTGLTLPLIASATATFLFRQTFMTIPNELIEAARMDGAGPLRFFWDIVLPMSRTNIAALFVILFIYGWNQYLWPLVSTTETDITTMVMSIKNLVQVKDQATPWHHIMTIAMIAMLPPIAIVLLMQKAFVQGLTETEK